ncbi:MULTISPECIES: hypothetical protein [Alicyclobacillus]|uniref:Secreted protein n=1 Tax=Alicyclobacillus sendaiensis PA2 TaxID=3029425 RepID=A0ABT6Y1I7_ALISE|nr:MULTISPECIES: hypothetical protein [Alicyclobacillus]MCL6489972.1 hypothetical protein [Alicyclobacillus mali (ex Roth et al. 2021)]MDI9261181.1 hypothetical protein [Alicyclobacillus sendaiensis PA2]
MKTKVIGFLATVAGMVASAPLAMAATHSSCHVEKVQTGWQIVKHVVLTDHGPVATFNAIPVYQTKTVC